jgi:two-component system sensor histidine kinase DegS
MAFRALDVQIAQLIQSVADAATELEQARHLVQREREEIDILHSLEHGESEIVPAPDTERMRQTEDALTEELLRARTLSHGLNDFASILSAAVRQIGSGRELPDLDAATQLAIQMARVRAQEEERRRFARDIHDGPAQAFANAIIGLEFVERAIRMREGEDSERPLEEIERIKGTMREGLTEIRRFIFDNRPTTLQDHGLVATLEHYIYSYQSIFPVGVELKLDGELPRLSPEEELTAFRVIQESIQNASKHSRATRIVVEMVRETNQVLIIIRDDGRGFDPNRVREHAMGGTGLKSMRERAILVGGTLEIESSPGNGSAVRLTLPLMAEDTTDQNQGL